MMNDWLKILGLINKSGNLITGEDNIINNIRNQKVYLVLVADDASLNAKKKYQDKCKFYNVSYVEASTTAQISHAIGKVNRVAIGICDKGFAKGLLAKITK